MSQLFSLDAQKCGFERHTSAEADGFGITVSRDGEMVRARSVDDAIRIARDYIGEFLQPAQRGEIPWGLLVTVPGGSASYGEWPLLGGSRNPDFQNTPLVRIRNRWHNGSGPLSALANAIAIIRSYAPTGRAGRAA
jgi:hypothetical protein